MVLSLLNDSVRVISQLSGQPQERDKANIAAKNAESAVTSRFLLLRLVSPRLHYANTRRRTFIIFCPVISYEQKPNRSVISELRQMKKKLAVKADRTIALFRSARQCETSVVLTLTLRTRRNMAASTT